MSITYLFIGLGIVSIGFLIYMLFRSFNEKETTTTITKPHPIAGGENIKYASSRMVTLGKEPIKSVATTAPKKEFTPKVKTYRKNVRVDNIIVENSDDVDMDDMIDSGIMSDVADAVDTMIDLTNTNNDQSYPVTYIDATPSFPEAVFNTPSVDYSPTPVQDSWSSSPSFDSGSSHSSYSDSSSSSSYDSGSSSSYDSGSSSSFDSGSSSSSFDSGSSW